MGKDKARGNKVAVVGLGIAGLATVKNLTEAGFDATGFEASSYVGGLWHYTEDAKTSVMPNTRANVSRPLFCYTDFPYPDGKTDYPTAAETAEYLEAYATHFNLWPRFRLSTKVEKVARKDGKWYLTVSETKRSSGKDGTTRQSVEIFDRVVLCLGGHSSTTTPSQIEGIEKFEGRMLTSWTAKRPADLANKSVLMIGFGSTSVDIARSLIPYAKLPIHMSHRRGGLLISRWLHGKPLDRPFFNLDRIHASTPLTLSQRSEGMAKAATQLMHATWPDMPTEEWGFADAPGMIHKQPVVAEEVYDDLKRGDIVMVPAIKRVTGARTVELVDGRVVEADAIISAAGYKADFSLLGEWDPSRDPPSAWTESKGHNGRRLGRWYYGIFSPDFPDSLANIETITYTLSATQNTDLASMVISQVWAGKSSLPSKAEMEKQVDKDQAVVIGLAQKDDVQPYTRDGWQWGLWADKMAGIGVLERVYGYSLKAWWFWLFDRNMYNMLRGGLMSPHIWRLFDDGKRKAWKGAREEIVKVNNL